ncbi:MAG: hypothetical protein ABSG26_25555 [Bryobacteraceae bacterium]|jgi:hypothetical protein
MSYSIVQSREERKLGQTVHTNAEIEAIRLVEVNAKCKSLAGDLDFPLSFTIDVRPTDAAVKSSRLTVDTRFFLKVTTKEKVDVISLECIIGADYTLQGDFTPSDEQIKAFQEGNAIFNCWPYFREYTQNTLCRMNYPPLAVPFLRVELKAVPKTAAKRSVPPAQLEQAKE